MRPERMVCSAGAYLLKNFGVKKEDAKTYHFWKNHRGTGLKPGSQNFWHPESPRAKYAIKKGLDANKNWLAKVDTVVTAPIFYLVTAIIDNRINALPDDSWGTPLEAPKLPEPFEPKSKRFGEIGDVFDEGTDAPGASRGCIEILNSSPTKIIPAKPVIVMSSGSKLFSAGRRVKMREKSQLVSLAKPTCWEFNLGGDAC